MLLDLPEQETWQAIALYLPPKDVFSFISVHRNLTKCLSCSPLFWSELLERDSDNERTKKGESNFVVAEEVRKAYMLQSSVASLSSVKWLPISEEVQQRQFPVKAREGHNSCVLNGPDGYKSLVITGGFSDDQGVTVITLTEGSNSHTSNWGWTRLSPRYSDEPTFVYGASLTPLPAAISEEMEKDRFMKVNPGIIDRNVAKAVRFGGFESGGYTNETSEVWVLTIVDYEYEDDTLDQFAIWEKMETNGFPIRARAYHSATFIHDRYLVIIGGMTHMGSCMEECILDTKTWTWIDINLSVLGEPNGRHGHSMVWDKRRDRLVMFGGGSGTDLLRTGADNNEVWELKMKGIVVPHYDEDVAEIDNELWEWSKIHKNTIPKLRNEHRMRDEYDSDDTDESEGGSNDDEIDLSRVESLCLGRCHNAMKISPDTALLMFGGGRPSTNGVLGYDLSTDRFLRPNIFGPLPVPRFTGVASFLESEGYILVHGGYNESAGGTVLDMNILDLAPSLGRRFTGFSLDEDRQSQEVVSEEDARTGQYGYDSNQRQMANLQRLLLYYQMQMNES